MIYGKPTKHGSGIEISGDYNDFRELNSFIYRMSEETQIPVKFQDYLLGFAYEVRKAYEGRRDVKEAGHPFADVEFEKQIYLAFKYIWIDYLLTIRLLRVISGLRPTTLLDQSILYRLDSIGFESLKNFDAAEGERIWKTLQLIDIFNGQYPVALIEQISYEFQMTRNGKPRFKTIDPLLKSIHPFSSEYNERVEFLKQNAIKFDCTIDNLSTPPPDNKSFKW